MLLDSGKGYIHLIRGHRMFRMASLLLSVLMLDSSILFSPLYGLTSGPSQPEASQFTPADISNLVDPFTGDFSYNIPLLDIGGYPINLAYNAGVGMDQEATWVGLGWNLNIGAINRTVRGLPDDFKRDTIVTMHHMRPMEETKAAIQIKGEAAGFPLNGLTFGSELVYSNYLGISIRNSLSSPVPMPVSLGLPFTANLGISTSPQGLEITPSLGTGLKFDFGVLNLNIGMPISSLEGMRGLSFSGSMLTKKKSVRGSAFQSYAVPSVSPSINSPFKTTFWSFSQSLGVGIMSADVDIAVTGSHSVQALRNSMLKTGGYGFLYHEYGRTSWNALLDFSRDKEGVYSMNTPYLPQTHLTPDIYHVNTHGVSGTMKLMRNDVGYVFNPEEYHPSFSGSLGLEVSTGNTINLGANVQMNFAESKSRVWEHGNTPQALLQYRHNKVGDISENVYFKMASDMSTETDSAYLGRVGGYQANMFMNPNTSSLTSTLWGKHSMPQAISHNNYRTTRKTRSQSIAYFTVRQVRQYYPHWAEYIPQSAPGHHIAAFVITEENGTRYVFSCPTYVLGEAETNFSMGRPSGASPISISSDGTMIQYEVKDRTTENDRGIDQYFHQKGTPKHVYSWLLTEVLSSDYVDVTGNGVSDDDLGTFTLIKYGIPDPGQAGKRLPNIPNYMYRTPISGSLNQANYQKGLLTDISDDRASIITGNKDIWYVEQIESKTQIVKFNYSSRDDGYGVMNLDGFVGGNPLWKIDRIDLYSKRDYHFNQQNSIPIKSVHFEYDYSLCVGVPNNLNHGGKLTLKKVYFSYRGNGRSKFSPYVFDYHAQNANENPNYRPGRSDRWGEYCLPYSGLPYDEFPYSTQNKSDRDEYVGVWSLKKIHTPTGGTISIEYESDDYLFVQNKQASRMFMLEGFGNSPSYAPTDDLFLKSGSSIQYNNYVYFKLDTPIDPSLSSTQADELVRKKYVEGFDPTNIKGPGKHLYFRVKTNVNHGSNPKYEYVSGYASIEKASNGKYLAGATNLTGGGYTHGWIKLAAEPLNDSGTPQVNPISKSAWFFSRMNTPRYAFNQPPFGSSTREQLILAMANSNMFTQLIEFFQGPNRVMQNKGFGSTCIAHESWIRLFEPSDRKLGGGHRVKRVRINDNWQTMESFESSFDYGQEYEYTLEDGRSSGVCAWEPAFGADENTHRVPIYFSAAKALAPDERFYQEEPLMESLFPGASVGYARVTVRNLSRPGVSANATGRMVREFYTAKDYPTRVQAAKAMPKRERSSPILTLLSMFQYDYVSESQGFAIELNDMHGKPKAQYVYAEGQTTPISGAKYHYLEQGKGKLSNEIDLLYPSGEINPSEVGVDFEVVADFQQQQTKTGGITIGTNAALFQVGLPVGILSLIPEIMISDVRFRLATYNKVVHRSGILVKTESFDLGAKVEQENLLWEPFAAQPVLVQVNNEFEDDRYSLTYPAYFGYRGMASASNNWGYSFFIDSVSLGWNPVTGKLSSALKPYLQPGDEVTFPEACFIYPPTQTSNFPPIFASLQIPFNDFTNRLWVSRDASDDYYLIDATGRKFTAASLSHLTLWSVLGLARVQVLRSGKRNQLGASLASYEMLNSPIRIDTATGQRYLEVDQSNQILSASSIEYDEFWKSTKGRIYDYQDTLSFGCYHFLELKRVLRMLNSIAQGPGFTDTIPFQKVNLSNLFPGLADSMPGGPVSCDYFFEPLSGAPTDSFSGLFMGYMDTVSMTNCGPPCLGFYNIRNFNGDMLTLNFYQSITGLTGYFIHHPPGSAIYAQFQSGSNAVLDIYEIEVELNGNQYVRVYLVLDDCQLGGSNCYLSTWRIPCIINPADTVNPYLYGFLGNWRPFRNYTYMVARTGGIHAASATRYHGYFNAFAGELWASNGSQYEMNTAMIADDKWKWVSEITNYNQYGAEIENMDALGVFSNALYGYLHTLSVATTQNASIQESAFEGFEDYMYWPSSQSCMLRHLDFIPYLPDISSAAAHTGRYSLSIATGASIQISATPKHRLGRRSNYQVPYVVANLDLLPVWAPVIGGENHYLWSFWVKEQGASMLKTTLQGSFTPEVRINSSPLSNVQWNYGPIIEGWQQVNAEFFFPSSFTTTDLIEFSIVNHNGTGTLLLDDFRIHPYRSAMTSSIYQELDFRLMSQLDENNYATFYQYDAEGKLIRVKKETERGVMTLQEVRQNAPKQ